MMKFVDFLTVPQRIPIPKDPTAVTTLDANSQMAILTVCVCAMVAGLAFSTLIEYCVSHNTSVFELFGIRRVLEKVGLS